MNMASLIVLDWLWTQGPMDVLLWHYVDVLGMGLLNVP